MSSKFLFFQQIQDFVGYLNDNSERTFSKNPLDNQMNYGKILYIVQTVVKPEAPLVGGWSKLNDIQTKSTAKQELQVLVAVKFYKTLTTLSI